MNEKLTKLQKLVLFWKICVPWFKINYYKIISLLLVIILASTLHFSRNIYFQLTREEMWEYKVVNVFPDGYNSREDEGAFLYSKINPNTISMNLHGLLGWELVSTYLEMETAFPNFGSSDYVTGIKSNVRPQRLVMIYKRKIR